MVTKSELKKRINLVQLMQECHDDAIINNKLEKNDYMRGLSHGLELAMAALEARPITYKIATEKES